METERLKLVPLDGDDLGWFVQINREPGVRKHLWDDMIVEQYVFEQMLEDNALYLESVNTGLWGLEEQSSGEIIGYAGFWEFFDEIMPELLFVITESEWRKGYATEVGRFLVKYALEDTNFEHLCASTGLTNVAAQKVCEKLGFMKVDVRDEQGQPTVFYKMEKD